MLKSLFRIIVHNILFTCFYCYLFVLIYVQTRLSYLLCSLNFGPIYVLFPNIWLYNAYLIGLMFIL